MNAIRVHDDIVHEWRIDVEDTLARKWFAQPNHRWSEEDIVDFLFASKSRAPGPLRWLDHVRDVLLLGSVGMQLSEWLENPIHDEHIGSLANSFTWTMSESFVNKWKEILEFEKEEKEEKRNKAGRKV